jgi:hypothetical protein
MEEVKKTVDDQEVVTEEVVETTESEESSPETEVEEKPLASVDEEEAPVEETEEEPEETQDQEDSSLKKEEEEEVPFNKNPKFQERVAEIETKYGKKAQMWDTLAKMSNNDPEFQLELTKRLEAAGELPKGTYEMAKAQRETSSQETQEPDEVSEKISSLPEVQFARELMRKQQLEQAQRENEIEGLLQNFERKHPEIASSQKPEVIRARIAALAEGYRDEGMNYEESLEQAHSILFNREGMIAEAREKGEIEGQIKSEMKSVVSTPSSSQGASKPSLRKLTREEEEARAVLNMGREEYIKFKDSDGFVE